MIFCSFKKSMDPSELVTPQSTDLSIIFCAHWYDISRKVLTLEIKAFPPTRRKCKTEAPLFERDLSHALRASRGEG